MNFIEKILFAHDANKTSEFFEIDIKFITENVFDQNIRIVAQDVVYHVVKWITAVLLTLHLKGSYSFSKKDLEISFVVFAL